MLVNELIIFSSIQLATALTAPRVQAWSAALDRTASNATMPTGSILRAATMSVSHRAVCVSLGGF